MNTNVINLSDDAINAIQGLQHKCGTYVYCRDSLSRLFNFILSQSDEIGMSDTETLHTLRVLDAIRSDLAAIAGSAATHNDDDADDNTEDVAARVAETFDDFQDPDYPRLDEGKEAMKDLNNTLDRLKQATYILMEAGQHAERSGKGDAVTSRLAKTHAALAEASSLINEMVGCFSSISQESKKD